MSLEMIKKINGYRIFMNKKIGKGAFGTVIYLHHHRYIKANRLPHKSHAL
jgi:hypothetical protein